MEHIDMNVDSGSSSNEDIGTRKKMAKPPKLRRSCELCRTHKARCLPSEGSTDRCQRCTRDGKACIFLAAKARPKRTINSKARVVEMEQRLDSLVALLYAKGKVNVQGQPTPEITPSPPACAPTPDLSVIGTTPNPFSHGLAPHVSSMRHDILNNPHQFALFSLPRPIVDNYGDAISKDIISIDLALDFLKFYQGKSTYYPFVIVPPHVSLDTLRREKPFLLLSILCFAAAQTNVKLTKALDQELRESLGRRLFVNGEKSLDLIQGILVYIVWYHFYFDPKRNQMYQLCQMVIAMVVDLNIHKAAPSPSVPNFSAIDLIVPPACFSQLPPDDPEVKRALLGCYVLTSSVCQSLRKPNTMRYTDYLGDLCSSFAQHPIEQSDHLLQYFVRLQHFQDDVNAAFDYDSLLNLQQLDAPRIEILLKTFDQQLSQFEGTFPPEVWDNVLITSTFHSLRIYLHEIGFHALPPVFPSSLTQNLTPNRQLQSWYHSPTRTTSLLTCLQASKTYLDHCLQLPPSALKTFTLPDFTRLIYALLILGSFACLAEFPHIQALADIGYYLDALHAKTSLLIAEGYVAECVIHLNHLFKETSFWHGSSMGDPEVLGRSLAQFEFAGVQFGDLVRGTTVGIGGFGSSSGEQEWGDMDVMSGSWPDLGQGIMLGGEGGIGCE